MLVVRHVGFLSVWLGSGKHKKVSCNFLFSLFYNTKLKVSYKNTSTHCQTLNPDMKQIKIKILFLSIPQPTKGKPMGGTKLCTFRCVLEHFYRTIRVYSPIRVFRALYTLMVFCNFEKKSFVLWKWSSCKELSSTYRPMGEPGA